MDGERGELVECEGGPLGELGESRAEGEEAQHRRHPFGRKGETAAVTVVLQDIGD